MKIRTLASFLVIISVSSLAIAASETPTPATPEITLRDPVTQQMNRLTPEDMANPDKVLAYVAPIDGASDLYQAYVSNGYLPFHSMLMTNWDVTQGLRILAPNIPENPQLEGKIAALKKSYHSAN
jgi:hypothetical protein